MLKSKAPSPIPYLVAAAVLLAGGYWWFKGQSGLNPSETTTVKPASPQPDAADPAISPQENSPFPAPQSVAPGTAVKIDGSTSMVTINQNLKQAFEQQFPGTQVVTQWNGSNQGIQALQSGTIDLAAISRPLTGQETAQGLQAVAVATDSISIVVGINNPFKGELTLEQVKGIFKGTIVNWSQVGGENRTIRVINRPPVSGTHEFFKTQVLKGSNFGTTPNITTLERDATTPLLRALGNDGIGYATYAQTANQQTVRVVPVTGTNPGDDNDPLTRYLAYVYKNPANPAVQAFLGYAFSPQGQQAIFRE